MSEREDAKEKQSKERVVRANKVKHKSNKLTCEWE
jgi:hypothetical protein